ncbi:hypothetical protein [Haloarcula argentinensis]|uniref:Uncharacterized protein n=1 Tax=Haloarcula argentinensis TaxID=43776 RepID=A0A830FRK1_HALAR|nr:hypothetical protein [Haloarcula argentinensis]GGM50632.1 hypothetical protein GCM10009006_34730 [Haloarcula argentinensis]
MAKSYLFASQSGTGMATDLNSLLLPIILLVVVELSGVAREVDLEEAVVKDYPPIFLPSEEFSIIPHFGRFNFIHGLNTTLILFGVLLLSGPNSQLPVISALILSVVWIALPVLEVEEYDDILLEGESATSIHWHTGGGIIAITYAVMYDPHLENIQYLGVKWPQYLLLLIFIFAVGVLLVKLESELETVYEET